jgi:NAD(P)-dependent dehydrogenase (short-subunit alcohol dehydrogenase family)
MDRFKDKRVWITGADTALGREAAKAFYNEGAKLLLSGIPHCNWLRANAGPPGQQCEALREGIAASGLSDSLCYEHNPINESHAENALKLLDTLDVTVIANQYIKNASLLDSTVSLFDEVIEQNLNHAWCAARATAGKIGKKRGGAILFISSIHGEKPSASAALYSVACGGINMLVKEAAQDFGRLGIRVNQLRCGPMEGDSALFKSNLSDLYTDAEERVPRGYLGKLTEAAKAALFLCSEDASFINGATVTADGGFLGFYTYGDSESRWDAGYGVDNETV